MKGEWLFGIGLSIGMMAALAYGKTLQQLLVVLLAVVFFCMLGKEEEESCGKTKAGREKQEEEL